MASQGATVTSLRRECSRDSAILSPVEKTALEFCRARASRGEPITQLEVTLAIGSQNFTGGTAAGVLRRLEEKGHITRMSYQRGLQVCIPETGECTAEPPCLATHWRNRTEAVPTPPIRAVAKVNHCAAHVIESEARRLGKAIPDFLMDLVWNGLQMHLEEQAA